jgi:hypothetical protein
MTNLWHFPPMLTCEHCDLPLFYEEEQINSHFEDYFNGIKYSCLACKKELDWWATFLHTLRGKSRHTKPIMAIGAHQSVFVATLEPQKMLKISLSDYGIPNNAIILHVSYNKAFPEKPGGLHAVEMRDTSTYRHIIPRDITLFPVSDQEYPNSDVLIEITVAVLWVHHTPDDEAWRQLTIAFDAYAQERYMESVIPANVAVESPLNLLMNFVFAKFSSKDKVRDFLTDGATYSHQLNVLLPAIVGLAKAPHMPDKIRGQLNRLRDHRNNIAHRGKTKGQINKSDLSECLCAALFGFHYIKLVRMHFMSDEQQ